MPPPGADQPQGPPLELIRVLRRQRLGVRQRHRLAHGRSRPVDRLAERVPQPLLDPRDGQVSDVERVVNER